MSWCIASQVQLPPAWTMRRGVFPLRTTRRGHAQALRPHSRAPTCHMRWTDRVLVTHGLQVMFAVYPYDCALGGSVWAIDHQFQLKATRSSMPSGTMSGASPIARHCDGIETMPGCR